MGTVVVGLVVAAVVLLAAVLVALAVVVGEMRALRAAVERVGEEGALPGPSGAGMPTPAVAELAPVALLEPYGPGGAGRPSRLVRVALSEPVVKAVAAGTGAAEAARSFRRRRGS